MSIYQDAIETGIKLKLFRIKNIKLTNFENGNIKNFNPNRLKESPELSYPEKDRPRGFDDIKSVKFWIKNIDKSPPIIIYKNILLDGAHRIVAHFIKKQKTIKAIILD